MTRNRTWLLTILIVTAAMVVTLSSRSRQQLSHHSNVQDKVNNADAGLTHEMSLVHAAEITATDDADHFWPQWRGPRGTGVAPHADPPVQWSETENIRWKISLPGRGHSTPIIWGDRIFITTAVPTGEAYEPKYSGARGAHDEVPITQRQKFMVIAVNRPDGRILWQRTLRDELPHAGGHNTASLASSSPVTDGEHLVVYFGSWGLYCLDLNGQLKWHTDFGQLHTMHGHGEGSSPALYRDTIIVNWDHEGQSFLVAIDKRTGEERWKVHRDAVSSWTTPLVVENGGVPQVIISGSMRIQGYGLATGRAIWECGGLSVENVVATPVAGHGMVYAGSSYDRQILLAIRLNGAEGDITGTQQVVWSRSRRTPYVPSPLLYGDSLYFHGHFQGILNRVNAQTGKDQPGPFRLNGIRYVFGSPVGAAGRVYITDRDGTTVVLSHDNTPETLALNRLNDSFSASAAVVSRELFLRGDQHLYCIAQDNPTAP